MIITIENLFHFFYLIFILHITKERERNTLKILKVINING